MEDYSRIQLIKTRRELMAVLDASICSQVSGMSHENGADNLEMFLDTLEQKGQGCFQELCQILEIKSPQLLLLLLGWEERGSAVKQLGKRKVASASNVWCQLRYNKDFLSRVLTVRDILVPLCQQRIISLREAKEIRQQETNLGKTEMLISILERKSSHYFDAFLESISTQYPHVFLKMLIVD